MYALVEFVDEHLPDGSVACEVIPVSWLTQDQTSCYWPGNSAYRKSLKNKSNPTSHWSLVRVLLKFVSEDIESVRNKREKFLQCSDLESSSKETLKRSKPVKTFGRVSSSSESDNESHVSKGTIFKLPQAPNVPMPNLESWNQNAGDVFLDIQIPSLFETVNPQASTSAALVNHQRIHDQQKFDSVSGQKIILGKLEEIIRKVDGISREINNLKLSSTVVDVLPDGVPTFPLTSTQDLDRCNVYVLAKSDHLKFLAKLMTNFLASKYNWAGTVRENCEPKLAIKDSSGILMLIQETTRKIFPAGTDKEIENCVKYWLKTAKGRLNSKSEKINVASHNNS